MLVFNWVDLIILLLLVATILGGLRMGLLNQFLVIVGFFGAMFLSGWILPHVLPIHDRTLLTLVNANLVLIAAIVGAIRGFNLSERLHLSLSKDSKLQVWESRLGVVASTTALLLAVWLTAAMVGRMPFEGFSNSVNDAYIIQTLDRHLPPVPAVLAQFNRLVNPNASPHLFVKSPQASTLPPSFETSFTQAVVTTASSSTVRVTSFGCGGIVSGTGFAVASDLIATNAHVVAGVKRPIIKYKGHSFEAVPVLFDSNLDYAILKVAGLNAQPLSLAKEDISPQTTVAVLGYPEGNYRVAPGAIGEKATILGRNIYDEGVTARDVYGVYADVAHGSSGGPLVLADGRVAGILFATPDLANNYAYALTSSSLINESQLARHTRPRVNTGVCLAG